MKTVRILTVLAMLAMFALVSVPQSATAQEAGHGPNFVDEDGDGYNDNAPDSDGDGIPNGQDPDFTPAGNGHRRGVGGGTFVDENGDGFNDNAPDSDGDGIPNGQDPDYAPAGNGTRRGARQARPENPGMDGRRGLRGRPNAGSRPANRDAGNLGDCDGTGPHGPMNNKVQGTN